VRLTPAVREFYAACGRGSGKSRIVALLACYFASREYPRAPGEAIYVGVFGPDRKQAGLTFRYILGLLRSVPALAQLIVAETRDAVTLSNGVVIEVITASLDAPRGRSYALCIIEEAAFLPTSEGSANPDVELIRAITPALARVPGSLLAMVSSPYAKRGALFQAWQRHHGQPDGDVVCVQSDTLSLNPRFDRRAVEKAYAEDPASAAAEFGGLFRSDLETFVSSETLAAVVARGVSERGRLPEVDYTAFVDAAGGSGTDSYAVAIAHGERKDGEGGRIIAVLDRVVERRPPFSPEAVTAEFSEILRRYGISEVVGDAFGGTWPAESFQREGIHYAVSSRTKSAIYAAILPRLNSRTVELLDVPTLLAQFASLERRTGFGGADRIDHPPRGHDDLCNVASGALLRVHDAARWGGDVRLIALS
jgi:hypothetical protein